MSVLLGTGGAVENTPTQAISLLTELPEAQATGEVRDIYAEIRHWSAVPMVALIYRHLATLPGALEWAWALVGPTMRSGQLQERAWSLAAEATVPCESEISRAALAVAGIDADDERRICAVLAAYNRGNPINIVAIRCLAGHLAGDVQRARDIAVLPAWTPPQAITPLHAMVDPQATDAAVRSLVMRLTRGNAGETAALWPSIYRHLAPWPAFIGYASVIVPPRFGAIDAMATQLREKIEDTAADLARCMPVPKSIEGPTPVVQERLGAAINRFSVRIPEMVVIGRMLRGAMPEDEVAP